MNVKVKKVTLDWNDLPSGLTWYFIGAPKTGKTTQASRWHKEGNKKVLLLDTDLGADFVKDANIIPITSLNAPKRPVVKDGKQVVKNGKKVFEIVPPIERGHYHRTGKEKGTPMETYSVQEVFLWLKENEGKLEYGTIVIDTIDQINEWIEDIVKTDMGLDNIADADWGTGWAKARKRNLDVVKRIQNYCKKNGIDLVLISHSKPTAVADGKVQLSPELPRGLAQGLTARADVIGYTTADKSDGKYYISFEAYDERTVGSRIKPLAQKKLLFDYQTIINEIKSYKEEE